MKRLFNFLAIAAIIAVGFTGCSSEEPVVGPNVEPVVVPPADEGELTYATFKFVVDGENSTKTKAMVTDQYEPATVTTFSSIRLLVFEIKAGDEGACLVDTIISPPSSGDDIAKSATVLVKSGQKRLLVIANTGGKSNIESLIAGTLNDTPGPIVAGVDPVIVGGNDTRTTYAKFIKDYNLYDIGTPAVEPAKAPTSLDFTKLVVTSASGTESVVYSNALDDTSSVRTLKPQIGYSVSQKGDNGEDDNFFVINVKRTVAKAFAYYVGSGSTANTLNFDNTANAGKGGTLSSLKYNVRHINRGVKLFQKNTSSSGPEAAYYDLFPTGLNEDDPAPFIPYFYNDDVVSTTMAFSTTVPTPSAGASIYLTESNTSVGYYGAMAYFAISGVYTPASNTPVITAITSFDPSLGQFTLTASSSSAIATGNDFYVLTDPDGFGPTATSFATPTTASIPTMTIFKDSVSLKKVVWAKLNNATLPTDATFQGSTATFLLSHIKDYGRRYIGGVTYYRLNFYEGSDPKANNFVARNYWYKAGIESFSELGSSSIDDLEQKPGGTNEIPTYVTAKITVLNWQGVETSTPVTPWPY